MWTVLKFDKKSLSLLREDLSKKLGKDLKYTFQNYVFRYKNNKLITKNSTYLETTFVFIKILKMKRS